MATWQDLANAVAKPFPAVSIYLGPNHMLANTFSVSFLVLSAFTVRGFGVECGAGFRV